MAGNSHRGDTPIEVGGVHYTLCYDLNAVAMVMEQLGIKRLDELAEQDIQSRIGVRDLIFILWAGLQHHHPELTEVEVGAMEWDLEEAAETLGAALERGLTRQGKGKSGATEEAQGKGKKRTGTGKQ